MLLSIAGESDKGKVRQAYRNAALKWHPDKHAAEEESEQALCAMKFKLVNAAYEVLQQ